MKKNRVCLTVALLVILFSCGKKTGYEKFATIFENEVKVADTLQQYLLDQRFSEPGIRSWSVGTSPSDRPRKGNGRIWVYRTNSDLIAFIETVDNGHAGEFGYAYSKSGKKPVWDHDKWGEFWEVGEQVNVHWWRISFRLG